MKEQENFPEEDINEMEIKKNLSETDFRIMMVKVLNSMRKDIVTMKKEQCKIKNDIAQIQNILEGIHRD